MRSHFWKWKYIKINYIRCISPKKCNFLLQRLFLLPKKNIMLKYNFLHVSLTFFWSVQHRRSTSIVMARGRLTGKWMKLKCQGLASVETSSNAARRVWVVLLFIEPNNCLDVPNDCVHFRPHKTWIYPHSVPDVRKRSFLWRRNAYLALWYSVWR